MSDGIAAVLIPDVPDYLRATVVGEVDVDIGRADTLRIEEALKEQTIAQRVDVRDLQQIGNHRPGGRSARHAGDTVVAAPTNKVTDDQEIRNIAGLLDDPEFQLQAIENFAHSRFD